MTTTPRKTGDDRKREIIEATRELVTVYGHKAVKMDDIAVSVGITKAAIFHHFKSKGVLLEEVVKAVVQEPLKAAQQVIQGRNTGLENILVNLFVAAYSCTQYKSTQFMALVDAFSGSYRQIVEHDTKAMVKMLASLLSDAEREGLIGLHRVESSPQQFAELLLMATYGVACPGGGEVLPPARLKDSLTVLIRSLLGGIAVSNR